MKHLMWLACAVTVFAGPAHHLRQSFGGQEAGRVLHAAERVAAQRDAHATFTVGTATATRGQKALGVLKVPAGSDGGYDIPVAVVHGARPGPVLAVASGAHGSEYASILAVQRLIETVNAADLSGTLILVPL